MTSRRRRTAFLHGPHAHDALAGAAAALRVVAALALETGAAALTVFGLPALLALCFIALGGRP